MKIVSGVIDYLNEVRFELSKVTWPGREQTIKMTLLVIIISVIIGAFLGSLDFILTKIVAALLAR